MASINDFRYLQEEGGGRVQIERSEDNNPKEIENKSGDPGRTPGKAEGEDDSSATDSDERQGQKTINFREKFYAGNR